MPTLHLPLLLGKLPCLMENRLLMPVTLAVLLLTSIPSASISSPWDIGIPCHIRVTKWNLGNESYVILGQHIRLHELIFGMKTVNPQTAPPPSTHMHQPPTPQNNMLYPQHFLPCFPCMKLSIGVFSVIGVLSGTKISGSIVR